MKLYKKIELHPIPIEDKAILRHLMELYLYDSSEFNGDDIGDHGLFGYKYLDHYWTDPERHPFFIRLNGNIAGFVLVSLWPEANCISEFFIMRKYRRKGIGKAAAIQIINMFPGTWHIKQEVENKRAQIFWRKIIGDYTGGNFEEKLDGDDPIQIFKTATEPLS